MKDVEEGILVDLSYYQSYMDCRTPFSAVLCVPNCPKTEHGYLWVCYGPPPKCFGRNTR